MRPNKFTELTAFIAVAEERSFRRAAARLDLTPSTLSHSVRALEERLGVRLLNRTTRTVAPTDAGLALLEEVGPAFSRIETAVENVNLFRARPRGVVRINVPRMAATMLVAPMFKRFADDYPDVTLEVAANDGFVDIVREGFDAGIRLGGDVDKDMVGVRISRDFRAAVVGAPSYFLGRTAPKTPHDLLQHLCIGWRGVSTGALYRWEFEKTGKPVAIQVTGPLVLDSHDLVVNAALQGVGLACVAETAVSGHVQAGQLVRVLQDWCPPFSGFYLYYPSRKHSSAALRALVDMLRYSQTEAAR